MPVADFLLFVGTVVFMCWLLRRDLARTKEDWQ